MEFFPSYFEWWHLPIVFIVGFISESYGAVVGGGGILLQPVLLSLGMPITSVIATENAGAIGTDLGVFFGAKKGISKYKKLIFILMISITLGGIIGTYLLLKTSADILKILVLIFMVLLVILFIIAGKRKNGNGKIQLNYKNIILLFVVMTFIGIYNNLIGVGEGTFSKIAIMTIFSLSFLGTHGLKSIAILPSRFYNVLIMLPAGFLALPYLLVLLIANFIAGKLSIYTVRKIPEIYLRRLLVILAAGYILYLSYIIFIV